MILLLCQSVGGVGGITSEVRYNSYESSRLQPIRRGPLITTFSVRRFGLSGDVWNVATWNEIFIGIPIIFRRSRRSNACRNKILLSSAAHKIQHLPRSYCQLLIKHLSFDLRCNPTPVSEQLHALVQMECKRICKTNWRLCVVHRNRVSIIDKLRLEWSLR